MKLICHALGHEAEHAGLWNEGYFFASCARCRCDLLRTDGAWSAVPNGYRVAWKPGYHRHAVASDFRRNLPLMPEAPRRWRIGLHRFGREPILLGGPPEARRRRQRDAEAGLPHLLLLGMVTALGMFGRVTVRGG